jgi:SAM-dependent methyltransferase
MDVLKFNQDAWDKQVERGDSPWTKPYSTELVDAARNGNFQVQLTLFKPTPADWLPNLKGKDLLGLASAGGQQGPLFAAAGANVTIIDNSPKQLAQDRFVAERDNLEITTILGDMADLSQFADGSFDIVFNPGSTMFVPDVNPIYAEAFRVLRPGGRFMTGFMNPDQYMFDFDQHDNHKKLVVKHTKPFKSADLPQEERDIEFGAGSPLEFAHSLDDLMGGQVRAGFMITSFFEDDWDPAEDVMAPFLPAMFATLAVKPLT